MTQAFDNKRIPRKVEHDKGSQMDTSAKFTSKPELESSGERLSHESRIRSCDITKLAPIREWREGIRQDLGYVPVSNYVRSRFQASIASALSPLAGSNDVAIDDVPPNFAGDFAVRLPALMRADMKLYASESVPKIIDLLNGNREKIGIAKIERKGPYVNITLDRDSFSRAVIEEVRSLSKQYGCSDTFAGKNLMIDFSSPNMGKSLHVGHVGTTLLGAALSNLYEMAGFTVFRVNHLGDWGTPVGFLKIGEEKFGENPEIQSLRSSPAKYYSALYAAATNAAKVDEQVRETAKSKFAALESGDPAMVQFWERVRAESILELETVYKSLGIEFDVYAGEGSYENHVQNIIDEVVKSGLARREDKAVIVDLEHEKLGSLLLNKSDGATTYMARDLAAIKNRTKLFGLDRLVYVVGSEQSLHFKQLFYMADKLGLLPAGGAKHVAIGLMTRNGKKISSREGGAMAFDEFVGGVYQECVTKSAPESAAAEDGQEDSKKIEETARQVSQAAIYFSQLKNVPGKDAEFNIELVTNTKGKSGPSIQYAAVRCRSIMERVGPPQQSLEDLPSSIWSEIDSSSFAVLKRISQFPSVIAHSASDNSAHYLTSYLDDLRSDFTSFIHSVVFRDETGAKLDAYKHILLAGVQVFENGLRAMNSEIPLRM